MLFGSKRIFLDHASTTPIHKDVLKAMLPYLTKDFANPSAIYKEGKLMRERLEKYRTDVARMIDAGVKDIVFTGSGTESDNLAILGVYEASKAEVEKPHFIISAIEHPGIKETIKEVVKRGGEATIISVDEEGRVNPYEIYKALTPNTVLVSVMLANNEIGTIEPIGKISRLVREYRVTHNSKFPYMHTDASQAANYLKISLSSLGVDLLTLDASKMYGPKGIGVLVVRPHTTLHPLIFGGGQEWGLRSGTESLALIAGFTEALKIAERDREKETVRLSKLKEIFIEDIRSTISEAIINTPKENSLPNIISISIPGMLAEFVAIKLDKAGFMISTGSSCGSIKDSGGTQTVVALGRPEHKESTLRFSLGRSTTKKYVLEVLEEFKKIMLG